MHQRGQLSGGVPDTAGQRFAASLLLGRDTHAASVILAVHSRRDPDLLVVLGLAVHRHRTGGALEASQQQLDGLHGIIDLFDPLRLELVGHLADHAVQTKANAVDVKVGLAAHLDVGQVCQIGIEQNRLRFLILSQIAQKIIARTALPQINLRSIGCTVQRVCNAHQCAVASAEQHAVILRERADLCAHVHGRQILDHRIGRGCIRHCAVQRGGYVVVICVGIVQNQSHSSLRQNL